MPNPAAIYSDGLIDVLCSEARTALDDPDSVGIKYIDLEQRHLYAIERLDTIIGALNPSEETTLNQARALSCLGQQLAERQSYIEQWELSYDEHSPATRQAYADATEALDRALGALDDAILALAPEEDDA
jgi:hypothetical protein